MGDDIFQKYVNELEKILNKNGIDVFHLKSKNRDFYEKIKNKETILQNRESITIEKAIESYLLTKKMMESKYYMGNHELEDSECTDRKVAEEIVGIFDNIEKTIRNIEGILNLNMNPATTSDIARSFTRKDSGLIEKLKKYLNFDLTAFDLQDKQYKSERCKILYFFYMLEYISPYNIKIFDIFKKPSIENLTVLDIETHNGMWMELTRNTLERELQKSISETIISKVEMIMGEWSELMEYLRPWICRAYINRSKDPDSYDQLNQEMKTAEELLLKNLSNSKTMGTPKYTSPPIETLALKIVQNEMLGQMMDFAYLNEIWRKYRYQVPSYFVNQVKILLDEKVDLKNLDAYIEENASRLAPYVYFKSKPDKEEVRKIKRYKQKLFRLINLFLDAPETLIDISEVFGDGFYTAFFIVCCLQAMIIDHNDKKLEFNFDGDQKSNLHSIRVALNEDQKMLTIMRMYWYDRVANRWHANFGCYEVQIKLFDLRFPCYEVLKAILKQPSLDEMLKIHQFYISKLEESKLVKEEKKISWT